MEQTASGVLDPRLNDSRVNEVSRTAAARANDVATTMSAGTSAASWGAIIAGAFVAASVSLILLALGSGLGFAEVSPWPNRGVSATTFTVTTAIWLIVMQWASAALGGYIAGRLRTRWVGTHTHEVFFRDTAHGLVTWSVASVVVAAVFASSAVSLLSGGIRAASNAAAAGAQGAISAVASSPGVPAAGPAGSAGSASPMTYGLDRLFRPAGSPQPGQALDSRAGADPRAEASRIVGNAVATGSLPDEDRTYLAEVVAARTGTSPSEGQRRVDELINAAKEAETKARAAADAARKAAAEASIYTALSMLIGAFIACVAAAMGGRLRDEHP